ncbi:DUF6916 family protein [Microterricola viridarii]|uniref:DUF6916 domain-containing protein n=1 Tax=Microterricola viridarii TaxID=412690 RepID=A0A120I1A9_9MICO|nr:hypothetical protein [Microterricola viridarii]AMB60049.1 hypothetical protein AWU67_15615 [Microterricola viridarii]
MSGHTPGLPSHAELLAVVGDDFAASDSAGQPLALTLTECSDLRSGGGYTSFSLTLRSADPREQGIFALSHATLGDVEIFLVPSGADASGTEYTASFTSLEA